MIALAIARLIATPRELPPPDPNCRAIPGHEAISLERNRIAAFAQSRKTQAGQRAEFNMKEQQA